MKGSALPVTGAMPEMPAVASNEPYEIIYVGWTNETDGFEMAAGAFEGGKDYHVTVTLRPKSGWVFPDSFAELERVSFDDSTDYVDADNSEINMGDLTVRSRTFRASSDPVITTVEIDMLMFGQNIAPASFLWSVILTFVFSLAVNGIMFFTLRKIDMIESLKSVE